MLTKKNAQDVLKAIGISSVCPKCGYDLLGESTVQQPDPAQSPAAKAFPHKIIFERSSDEGHGDVAVIFFPTLSDHEVTGVVLNGETATKVKPHSGHPVFKMTKNGNQYQRPLKFSITYNGVSYTAEVSTQPTPSMGRSETVKPSSYGNGDRGNARFSRPGSWYGRNVEVWIGGVLKMVVADGAKRQEGKRGLVWKPISENDKKLVVIGEYGVRYNSCTIKW